MRKLGSVAPRLRDAVPMSDALLTSFTFIAVAALAVVAANLWWTRFPTPSTPTTPERPPSVGIGTVRSVADRVTVEVESVSGQRFVGRLHRSDDVLTAALRPGVVLLVSFDPAARERLSLADDADAIRSAVAAR